MWRMKYEYQDPPKDDKEGFTNALMRVANLLEDANFAEARYAMSDIIDTFSAEHVTFSYGVDRTQPNNPRGDMTDEEWSRIVD